MKQKSDIKYKMSLILLGLVIPGFLFSQKVEKKVLNGSVIEETSNKPIELGAIKNMNSNQVTLTDELGHFELTGSVGDTLRFHSLGYADTTWVVASVWYLNNENIELKVKPNSYAIDEVQVVRFYSYAHFKQAFKDLRLPEDENERVRGMVSGWDFSEAIALGKADKKFKEGTLGISFSVGGRPHIDKQREEVMRLEKIADESERFNYFISRENISELTSYHGTCLDSFMVFLNSSYSISYKMQEYELLTSIRDANKSFKVLKGSKEWYSESDSMNVQ